MSCPYWRKKYNAVGLVSKLTACHILDMADLLTLASEAIADEPIQTKIAGELAYAFFSN